MTIILGGFVAVLFLPIDQYPDITPPTVTVTATYPGADAQEVADTIGAPIEESVNGVENMMYMSSQSTNNGQYQLTVTFEIGTDLNTAQVLVENRAGRRQLPLLPSQVQMQGVTTQKKSPSILLAVSLISPDNRYDELYLSNYATIQLRDELLRIKGVGDITIFGERDYAMRLWLDPNKLATRDLTAVDVVNAIKNQNVQDAAGQVGQEPVPSGQQFQMPMRALGRLESVKQFGDIIAQNRASGRDDRRDRCGRSNGDPAGRRVRRGGLLRQKSPPARDCPRPGRGFDWNGGPQLRHDQPAGRPRFRGHGRFSASRLQPCCPWPRPSKRRWLS